MKSDKEHRSVVLFYDYIRKGDADGYSMQRIVGPFDGDEAQRVATKAVVTDGLFDRAEVVSIAAPSLVVDTEETPDGTE